MKEGDVIRVSGWPGTRGKRFIVMEVLEDKPLIEAFDTVMGHTRWFPVEACSVDRRATRARQT